MAKFTKKPPPKMAPTKHPGVYKLPSGRYLARLRTRNGSASQAFSSVTTAKRWLTEKKAGLEAGQLVIVDSQVMTKKEAARASGRTVADVLTPYSTVAKCKAYQLRGIQEHLGHIAIAEVTKADLVSMLDEECAGKAPATRNQYLSATSMLFKYAMERDWCDSNPATLVSRLSEKGNERDRVITPTEEQALQDAFDKQGQLGVIFDLLMGTGARIGEVCELRWRDVDLNAKTIRLSVASSKTHKARTLHLAGKAWDKLKAHSKVMPINESAWVFPNAAKTAPVDGSKIFRKHQPEPLAWWTPHYCRHTWATRVAALPGMNVQQLCSLAGWGSWQMAERYSHLMDIGSADLMEQLAKQYS